MAAVAAEVAPADVGADVTAATAMSATVHHPAGCHRPRCVPTSLHLYLAATW
jgi:hypothetical protein